MNPNLVSATLSLDDQQDAHAAVNSLRQKLPFLIDLSDVDRRWMPKLGNKTQAFVRKAAEIANEHAEMFAPAFLDEMRRDMQLLEALSPILFDMQMLVTRIDDTKMQLGAEAYAAAHTVYTVTKTPFAKAAMQMAADDLARRYGRKKKAQPAPAAEPQPSDNRLTVNAGLAEFRPL